MVTPAEDAGVWSEQVRIHFYDVDFRHHATLESLCRIFLEAAWNHAEQLGVGFRHLAARNRFWVLSRMVVEVDGYPRWGDQVKLHTWPRGASSLFAMRDFEIFASSGTRLLGGASAWLVLDACTRRPQRIQSLVASIHGPQKAALKCAPQKLSAVESSRSAMAATAHYSAIDVNSHVNSARYIGWILDSYPFDFHRNHCLCRLEVNYLGETLPGDQISVHTAQRTATEFCHSVVKSDAHEVCRAQLVWADAEAHA